MWQSPTGVQFGCPPATTWHILCLLLLLLWAAVLPSFGLAWLAAAVSFAGVTFLSRSVLGHLTGGPSNSMFLTLSPLLCDTAIGMCFHAQNGFVQCQLLRYLHGRAFASPLVGVKSVWLLDTVLVHAGASMHTMTVSASCDEARVWPSMHATSMGCQDSQPFKPYQPCVVVYMSQHDPPCCISSWCGNTCHQPDFLATRVYQLRAHRACFGEVQTLVTSHEQTTHHVQRLCKLQTNPHTF